VRALSLLVALAIASPVAIGTAVAADASESRPDFDTWLEALRTDALARDISAETLDVMLDGIEPIDRVIELDRNQPESRLTFEQYLDRVVPDSRVRTGRARLREHRALLEQVGREFDVQPRFIVALWGIESDFGRRTGGFQVIDALATLAWDGRRAEFFRRELLDALKIVDDGHVAPDDMKGSWAGAMGQAQFMPSTFHRHAVDFDGDSRRDIWNTYADVFASAAKYLSSAGWSSDQTWGRRVRLPAGFDANLVGLKTIKRIGEWQALGVRRADGTNLPTRSLKASIVRPDGDSGPAYMVYENYRTLLDWNRSLYFATAVGILSDQLR
jgi:membrane-bound lytic murein transglycosylase B